MNEMVKVFDNHSIRILQQDGEPWFVAKDVCQYFGDTDHKRSISRMDEDETQLAEVIDSLGRKQKATVINEAGLYRLLFNFQPEQARTKDGGARIAPQVAERLDRVRLFKRWVTHNVLPDIRKNGAYLSPAMSDDQMKALVATLEQEIYRRVEAETRVDILERQMEKLALQAIPKRRFGEISERTGLPMDKVIQPHIRSDSRSHAPQFGKYVQLLLPLYVARELLDKSAYPMLTVADVG